MAVTVTGLFTSRDDAERAAAALMDHDVDRDQISLLTRGPQGEYQAEREDNGGSTTEPDEAITTTTGEDAGIGASAGVGFGVAAGLAAAAMALFVPGFGWVTAAGPLAWALGGIIGTTAAGAVVGGVLGGLRDMGADEQAIHEYEEGVRQGSTFLSARGDTLSAVEMSDLLSKYNAVNIRTYVGEVAMAPVRDVSSDATMMDDEEVAAHAMDEA